MNWYKLYILKFAQTHKIENVDRAKQLMNEIDQAYETKDFSNVEEKENELELLLEEIYAEDEDEEPDYQDTDELQGGLQDQLSKSYYEYINKKEAFSSNDQKYNDNMLAYIVWDSIISSGGKFKQYMSFENISDFDKKDLIDIAEDCYKRKVQLFEKKRKNT